MKNEKVFLIILLAVLMCSINIFLNTVISRYQYLPVPESNVSYGNCKYMAMVCDKITGQVELVGQKTEFDDNDGIQYAPVNAVIREKSGKNELLVLFALAFSTLVSFGVFIVIWHKKFEDPNH